MHTTTIVLKKENVEKQIKNTNWKNINESHIDVGEVNFFSINSDANGQLDLFIESIFSDDGSAKYHEADVLIINSNIDDKTLAIIEENVQSSLVIKQE
ncbi:hypothetical protein MF621_003987 (plasmid) [Bacillus velezensis]|uniref:hypothetical protein n=1 Tax=Bacillus velezensis TaxID=492670 RepID=UPI0020259821|nr:hypothetical protein [Bacillus velezensis]URJ76452.1 hypothetical protein MF619_004025 [Bacillus velezensis]URJ80408.1 hypothetical protein MF621_003987 [Bacillus velezensis]